jgi:superfamily II DNA or RNA helicase
MSNNYFIKRKVTDENGLDTQLQKSSQKLPSISLLKFPFILKEDQTAAVNAWINNNHRGTILYSTGTGKTEIAFECAKILATHNLSHDIQLLHTKKSVSDIDKIPKDGQKEFEASLDQNNFNIVAKSNNENVYCSFFNILFLVPRISLIDQTISRLISYGIPKENVAAYFGERKEIAEIIISTYHSVIRNPNLIRRSNMVIFDEVHLISDTSKSFRKIFDIVVEDPKKAILGLTATLDKKDFKNNTILTVLPPVIEYSVSKAVKDKRLAKPIVIPIKVSLTEKEQEEYNTFSTKIKNISNKFKRYDVNSMTDLLKKGGFASGMAKAWFANIRKRKLLLSYAENKLSEAAKIISKKFPDEKIMIFSETIESIEKLKDILKIQGIESKIIDAKVKASERQTILKNWGITFKILLSVHTLEIGYDVPQVRIEIILASTSNINQIAQRVGRVLRKHEGKNIALIYVIYVPDTKDDNVIEVIQKAVEGHEVDISDILNESPIRKSSEKKKRKGKEAKQENVITDAPIKKVKLKDDKEENLGGKKSVTDIRLLEKKIQKAYNIIESSLQQGTFIIEQYKTNEKGNIKNNGKRNESKLNNSNNNIKKEEIIYRIMSSKDKDKFYEVNLEKKSCTCADFVFRKVKCKHIIAAEIILP